MLLIELNNLSAAVEKNKYSDYEKESNSIGSVIKSRRCEMKKTLEEIKSYLATMGLTIAMDLPKVVEDAIFFHEKGKVFRLFRPAFVAGNGQKL